jgi:predicted DCC family thiol-disulfide oxidoreductase YuxK
VKALTVLYDARCSVCCRARRWLSRQPSYVDLEFVRAGSAEARDRYPELSAARTQEELTVVGDDGSIYRGAKAWLICLWALRQYRSWSLTLSSPALLPSARRFVGWASRARRPFIRGDRA